MSKLPLVSIIILNYNGQKFLADCLDSVFKTDYPNFEIIIVDNHSTDGSGKMLAALTPVSSRQTHLVTKPYIPLKVIFNKKNFFFAEGNNIGARKAQGKYLVFLNNDTVVDKNWLKELVSFAKNHPQSLVQPKILKFKQEDAIDNVGGDYSFFGFGKGRGRGEKDIGQYDKNGKIDFANGTCFIINKKLFVRLGGFDNWYRLHYEDVDLSLRARKAGKESWYCYKSAIYHKGSLTIKSKISKEELLFNIRKNRLRTVIKNFSGGERMIRMFFLLIGDLISVIIQPKTLKATIRSIIANINLEIGFMVDKHRLKELKKTIKKEKGFTLLDIGCGDGLFVTLARQKGIDALGIDKAVISQPRIISSSLEKFKTRQKFDAITMFHFLEHVKDPRRALQKAKKLLKDNGVLVIELPLVNNWTEKFLQKDYFAYQDKSHRHFFSENEIQQLLEQSGFAVKKQGFTLYEFPFTVITTGFKKNLPTGLLGIILFLPLKTLSFLGYNDEIGRFYCFSQ